ncbi:hypothetical protein N868_03170 [Cellulomonas carbonis T26]|uniref:Ig-like domain-containing protein n=1 Tax=Cellulomonas carbonis T26 TaxID=947969 RepID=A0A0A0BNQ3_9CELL|nr:hypothetical protein N868_03170 [Cellulomonas carbonis T26]
MIALSLTALGTVGLAGPAAADHYSSVTVDGSSCYAGGLSTGIGYDLFTTDVRVTYAPDGSLLEFTCRFPTTPAPDENWYVPWTGKGPYVMAGVVCADEDGRLFEESGTFRITPNGKATLRCRLPVEEV